MEVVGTEPAADAPASRRQVSGAELIESLRSLSSPAADARQVEDAAAAVTLFVASESFPPSLAGVLSTLSSTLKSAVASLLDVCRACSAPGTSPTPPQDPSGSPLTPPPPPHRHSQNEGLDSHLKTAGLGALEACANLLRCLLQFCHEKEGIERWQLALMKTAEVLHSELLGLLAAPDAEVVQSAVVDLCEAALMGEWKGYAVLAPQLLPLLLAAAIDTGNVATIRRFHALKKHLLLFDFSDEASIVGLKTLMLQAAFAPAFLRSRDGRKFIAFLFTVPLVNQDGEHEQPVGGASDLNPNGDHRENNSAGGGDALEGAAGARDLTLALAADVMAIIQNQIPSCRKSVLKAYGSILLDAILMLHKEGEAPNKRAMSARKLGELEDHIKSLGYTAIYVRAEAVSKGIRTLLEIFHAPQTRRRSTVEGFLYRLWAPHIFRALASPNENVRRRATQIFAEIFPFDDPDASEEAAAQDACRQLEALTALFDDPAPTVRMAAAGAAGRALALVWELLLPMHRDVLLNGLIRKLAKDASSAAVRVAAVQAIGCIARNPLAQNLLKKRLAEDLPRLLRDRSPAVRASMAQLLETVADTQHIRFFDIASDEDILDCLCATTAMTDGRLQGKTARSLVSLLLPSVFPAPPEGEEDDEVLVHDITMRVFEVVKAHGSAAAAICQAAAATGNSPSVLLRAAARLIEMACEQEPSLDSAEKNPAEQAKRLKTEMHVPAALAAAASIVEAAERIRGDGHDGAEVAEEDLFDLDLIAQAAQRCGCDRCLCQAFRICAAVPPSDGAEAIINLTTRVVGRAEAARTPVLQAMVHLTRRWGGYDDFVGHLRSSLDHMLAQPADSFEDRQTLESLVGLVRMLLVALESSANYNNRGENRRVDWDEEEWIPLLSRVKTVFTGRAIDDPRLEEIAQMIENTVEISSKLDAPRPVGRAEGGEPVEIVAE